jgi:dipeptidyl aminopeptidase/acylaminoacyl peptidase
VFFVARIAYHHYIEVTADFTSTPPQEVSRHPEATGIAGLQEVSFQSADSTHIAGWYVTSRNRAAVVLTHGTNTDRSSVLLETRALSAAGFGVLAFDWPGNGGSGGRVEWGRAERNALGAAVDWLSRRSDVDKERIGGAGFSMGGFVMAQVAATDKRIRAVLLAATPTDYAELTKFQHRQWGVLSEWPASLALRSTGMRVSEMRPIDVVGQIAPRPLMLIAGDEDEYVPLSMEKALYAAAAPPKEIWIVPKARHLHFERVAPDSYPARLVDFFDRTLNR